MKYKAFSNSLWTQIEESYSVAKKQNQELIAAFDADGTLWDTDLGENYFSFQIEKNIVPLPDLPWEHYLNLKKQNPEQAYLWLAQIHQGVPLKTVQEWARQALLQLQPVPIFEEQKKLIEWFIDHKVKVYIITASVKWAVEPGAQLLGLNEDSVLGVQTAVENGLITNQKKSFITYREGKVSALLEKTAGCKPFFSCGNSNGDIELLKAATHLSLAVCSTRPDDKLYKAEQILQQEANKNSWATHNFIS